MNNYTIYRNSLINYTINYLLSELLLDIEVSFSYICTFK